MNKTLGIIGIAAIFAAVLGMYAIPGVYAQSSSSSGAATDDGSSATGSSGSSTFGDSSSSSAAGEDARANAGSGFSDARARR